MASPLHAFLVPVAVAALVFSGAAAAELAAIHGRMAAEWAWSTASDESCWGSPEGCPAVYDVGADGGAAGMGRRRLQYYYDVNTSNSFLPTTQYISYSALTRDSVPCSVPGASYSDANPYTRGCSAITQCRD